MQEKNENLKAFFILRLCAVMLFILFSESLVNLLISQGISPFFSESLGMEVAAKDLTMLERFGMLIRLFLYFAGERLYAVTVNLFPAPVLLVMQRLLEQIRVDTAFPVQGEMNGMFMMAVTVLLILYILPYVIGIIAYSLMVVHKVEEIRRHDRQQREQFIQRRNLLLSDITHDLKTPITTISGYAQALREGVVESPEKQQEYLGAIYAKSMQMNRLITLLFDYVKLDSEGFGLKKEEVNLPEFLREISAEMYADIESAGMELQVELPQRKCKVMIDKSQFARVVVNLLANAVRHNPRKTQIRISLTEGLGKLPQNVKCSEGRIDVGREAWQIQIADTGDEIADTLAVHLFEPFVMGDASRNSRAGSGLGLSIAAKIVEMHGGRMSLNQPAEAPYRKVFLIELPKEKAIKEDDYKYDE